MSRRLTRSYAIANLEDIPVTNPTSTKEKKRKRKRIADDTASEGDDKASGGDDNQCPPETPKPKGGRPRAPAKKKPPKLVAPKVGKEPVVNAAGPGAGTKPQTVKGKVLPPRSPQPGRTNRNTNPSLITAPRAKKTSAEVTAAAKRKADLQKQANELERQRIQTLTEIELQEELENEAEECAVVKKLADASGLDGVEDVEMRSDDLDGDAYVVDADHEQASESDGDGSVTEKEAAPKRIQVCLFRVLVS